ncbi:MAG: thioesterase [Tissierellia bacterium]|nr:thioesterase [Tissierellia bacterium]
MTLEKKPLAIQDTYGDRFQHCWGCGPQNPEGLHIQSFPQGDQCICRFHPGQEYTGGVPANLFGGFIALLFDCHGTASAAWFAHRAKGLDLQEDTVIGRFITARLEIDFKKPTPMDQEVLVVAKALEMTERKVMVSMVLEAAGEVRAQAKMVAVAVKDHM